MAYTCIEYIGYRLLLCAYVLVGCLCINFTEVESS